MRASQCSFIFLCMNPLIASAAESDVQNGLSRMVLGMVVVLLLIGVLAWLARKILPGHAKTQSGILRQITALHLSPRERVVVLEIGGRWLVVGINGSQMTALADLPVPMDDASSAPLVSAAVVEASSALDMQASFAHRLQQAMQHTLRNSLKSFNNKA